MLLTITTTHQPATDLGYLLHKHPERVQTFKLNFGQAHVFYPETSEQRCTIALLLDVDPVHLVRGRDKSFALEQYVNDRPYVASSFLSVALSEVFGTALNGHCNARPELVDTVLPLKAHLVVVPCRGEVETLRSLFEPLGYTVTLEPHVLDEQYPEWGMSPYYSITLEATCRLSDLLSHIYVLIPVLDNAKHYWIGDDEVEKLLKRGQGWLEQHPQRNLIARRYLRNRSSLVRSALARLLPEEAVAQEEELAEEKSNATEEAPERHGNPHEQRLLAVMEVLQQSNAHSVLDLGCGEGKLLKLLLASPAFERILGLDVSYRALEYANKRLRLERLPANQRKRITLLHGSLTYRDKRLEGYDAATVVEVIEHLDEPRLAAFERVLFEFAQPATVVITTPNAEYNVKFAALPAGQFRHEDHRFEWTRQQFQDWAERVAGRYGYVVRYQPMGPQDDEVGALSQMGIFSRQS
ncbi:MAG: 3' terminal RNA ribose 2'-O-methyltransferase Hen1 [Chloroflexi bacterium]|nr:MAG: 3' terminal RNA ribose 2'-O-methyltransferase Hen1 [Chloroflexota bacterium]